MNLPLMRRRHRSTVDLAAPEAPRESRDTNAIQAKDLRPARSDPTFADMSLLRLFEKFVDPVNAREREAELKKLREERPDDADPELVAEGVAPPLARKQVEYVCKVCDHRGAEPEFCPDCLAATMKPVV